MSMKQALNLGEPISIDKLLPMIAMVIKRARLRAPNTGVILDGYPKTNQHWEVLERGELPFESCVLVVRFSSRFSSLFLAFCSRCAHVGRSSTPTSASCQRTSRSTGKSCAICHCL